MHGSLKKQYHIIIYVTEHIVLRKEANENAYSQLRRELWIHQAYFQELEP